MSDMNSIVQDYVAEGTRFSFLDPSWSVARDSFPGCAYEPVVLSLLSTFLDEPDAVFADVGSLYGFFACWAARRVPGLPVAAFEPEPRYVDVLRRNIELNDVNVQVAPYALCEGRRTLNFHTRTVEPEDGFGTAPRRYLPALRNHVGRSGTPVRRIVSGVHTPRTSPVELLRRSAQWSRMDKSAVDESHTVDGISLDEWCDEHELWPTVVKVDVHGAEGLVLRGMKDSLARSVRHVLLELHTPDMLVDTSHVEILDLLEGAGFELFEVRGFRRHTGVLVPLVGPARDALLDISRWPAEDLYYMKFLYARRRTNDRN